MIDLIVLLISLYFVFNIGNLLNLNDTCSIIYWFFNSFLNIESRYLNLHSELLKIFSFPFFKFMVQTLSIKSFTSTILCSNILYW